MKGIVFLLFFYYISAFLPNKYIIKNINININKINKLFLQLNPENEIEKKREIINNLFHKKRIIINNIYIRETNNENRTKIEENKNNTEQKINDINILLKNLTDELYELQIKQQFDKNKIQIFQKNVKKQE